MTETFSSIRKAIENTADGSRSTVKIKYDHAYLFSCEILKGQQKGPALWIQAGLHGDEYDGIIASWTFANRISLNNLSGTLIIVPVANPMAFSANANKIPQDQKNVNRVFPGNPFGSYSERYAHWLFHSIISNADYFVDLHGGGKYLDVAKFIMIAQSGQKLDRYVLEIARLMGANYILINSSSRSGMLYAALSRYDIPSWLVESGGGSYWTRDTVDHHVRSIYKLMCALNMYPKQKDDLAKKVTEFSRVEELYFPESGIQLSSIKAGYSVSQDDCLIEWLDPYRNAKQRLLCPVKQGVVLSIHSSSFIAKGDYAVMIGMI